LPNRAWAVAAHHLGGNEELVANVKRDFEQSGVSEKLKALLAIAGKVQQGGKQVTSELIEKAKQQGATDKEIHDTVLIAAAFCMYNRYVDGLATWAPTDVNIYRESGKRLAEIGYIESTQKLSVAAQG
jgi:alkylhydroperoxidase/carboxymuconolactone decarboxylase family protein YurZ